MSVALKVARVATQGGMPAGINHGQGGLLSGLGRAVGKVAGAGLALATGGGVGGAARALGIGGSRTAVMPGTGLTSIGGPAPIGANRPGGLARLQRFVPFGATGMGEGCPSGYHPNRSAYYTRDGFVEKGSKCVRNRKRNPLNPRALDRSMGRLRSAGKAIRALGFKAPAVKEVAQGKFKKKKR